MSTIKKYFKAIILFLAFAICSVVFALNPSLSTYATMSYTYDSYNQIMSTVKMPKAKINASKGEKLEIPLLNTYFDNSAEVKYSIKVTDPAGQKYYYNVGEASNDSYFTFNTDKVTVSSLANGLYHIQYIINANSYKFYSRDFTVTVENVSYELDFTIIEEGDKQGQKVLLPKQVKQNSAAIQLPVARVKITGSDDEGVVVQPRVYRNGAELARKDGANNGSDFYTVEGVNYINPTTVGKYTVEYVSDKGSNRPSYSRDILVSADFVAPTSEDIKINDFTVPSGIELGKKGIVLPKLTVNDKYNNNVDYNITQVEIAKVNSNIKQVLKATDNLTFDMTLSKFENATSYKDLVGEYTITYTIVDAYGNTATITNDRTKQAVHVTDSSDPKVYMAYAYDLDADGNPVTDENGEAKVNTNYNIEMRDKYGYAEIVMPAIYANDLVNEYKDLKLYRYIRIVQSGVTKYYYLDNMRMENGNLVEVHEGEDGYNYAQSYLAPEEEDNTGIGKYNQAVTFRFAKKDGEELESKFAGDYTLGYYVRSDGDNAIISQDNYLYASGTSFYKFTVADQPNVTTEADPSVKITNLNNSTTKRSDETVNIEIEASDENDKNLKNVAFYYYGDVKASIEDDLRTAINAVLTNKNSDASKKKCNVLEDSTFTMSEYEGFKIISNGKSNESKFEVKFDDYADQNKIIVGVISLNNENRFAVQTKVINIRTVNDAEAPTVSEIKDGGSFAKAENQIENGKTFEQNVEVTLPTVEFDDADNQLEIRSIYYIDKQISASDNVKYRATLGRKEADSDNDGKVEFTGGKIITDTAGNYYVIYTATDIAGNVTSVYFNFVVESNSSPKLTVHYSKPDGEKVNVSGNTITEDVGASIIFEQIVTLDGEDVTESATVNPIDVDTKDEALDWYHAGDTYTFNTPGTYYLTFSAQHNGKQTDDIAPIIVNIKEPTLSWVNLDSYTVKTTATPDELIELPCLTASYGLEVVECKPKVVGPDEKEIEVTLNTSGEQPVWQFTTYNNEHDHHNGEYKVTYQATVGEAKTPEQVYTIRVGDNVAPTITVPNKSTLEQDIVYTSGQTITYTIDLTRTWDNEKLVITVKNGDNLVYTCNTGLTITDIDDVHDTPVKLSWTDLTVTLSGTNVSGGTREYRINGTGECTLTLKIKDNYGNEQTETIKFNVVEKAEQTENNNNTVLGIVLIVISLIVLAGVILFFVFTGRGNGNNNKSNKKSSKAKATNQTQTEEEVVVENADNAEVESETSTANAENDTDTDKD